LAPYQWEVEEGKIIYLVAKNNDGTTVTFSFEADEVGGGEEPEEPAIEPTYTYEGLTEDVSFNAAANSDTFVKFVATEAGKLTVNAGTSFTYLYVSDTEFTFDVDAKIQTCSIDVEVGDVVYLAVYCAGADTVTLSFSTGDEGGEEPEEPELPEGVAGSGTETDPYVISGLENGPVSFDYALGSWTYATFTAPDDAAVTVVITNANGTSFWPSLVSIDDFANFQYSTYTVTVEAGATLYVTINGSSVDTYTFTLGEAGGEGGEGGETPDPDQPVEPEEPAVGTADKPYEITDLTENVVISIPAGEDFYIQYTATADGLVKFQTTSYYANFYYSVVEFSKDTSSFSAPSIVVRAGQTLYMIVNDYYGYDLTVSFSEGIPAGLKENPHDLGDLVEDETVVKSSSNYYFVFTAPANGKLTITSDYSYMNLDYDFESINNLSTLGAYPPVEVEMTKGQTIYVLANGYDNTKTVTFSFEAEPDEPASVPVEGGSASEPTTITESATYTVVVAAGEKAYFSIPNTAIGSDAVYATITVEGATLYVNEVACADGSFSGVIDLTAVSKLVAIENNGEESATITFVVTLDVAEDSGDDPF
jgi:hypothetical protein